MVGNCTVPLLAYHTAPKLWYAECYSLRNRVYMTEVQVLYLLS
jgi:hypothetical protein